MEWRLAADALLIAHAAFVAFAVAGGWLALGWRRVRRALEALHLPALAWGLWIELSGGICPLTPLENAWRARAGQAGYEGGFIEHYLLALLYPDGLTQPLQWALAAGLLAINAAAYGLLWRQRRRMAAAATESTR